MRMPVVSFKTLARGAMRVRDGIHHELLAGKTDVATGGHSANSDRIDT